MCKKQKRHCVGCRTLQFCNTIARMNVCSNCEVNYKCSTCPRTLLARGNDPSKGRCHGCLIGELNDALAKAHNKCGSCEKEGCDYCSVVNDAHKRVFD